MVRYIKHGEQADSSVICHYGRSKEDGAPGVGTGNWRRIGGSINSGYEKLRKRAKAIVKKAKKRREEKIKAQKMAKEMAEKTKQVEADLLNPKKGPKEVAKEIVSNTAKTIDKQMEINPKSKQEKGDKDNAFDKLSDDELREYTTRLNLEKNARDAEVASKLQKIKAPIEVIKAISSYGNAAVDAYGTYRRFSDTFSRHKDEVVPRFTKPISDMNNTELQAYKNRMLLEKDVRNLRNEVAHPKDSDARRLSQQLSNILIGQVVESLNKEESLDTKAFQNALSNTDFGNMLDIIGQIQKLENIESGKQDNQNNKNGKNGNKGG